MSDTSADAGVVQSRSQLERLITANELAGRTIAGFAAISVGLRGMDLDSTIFERVDVREADGDEARLERAELRQLDGRKSTWRGALWNRVRAGDCDLTEICFAGATLLRCELGPVRLPRASFHRARISQTTFRDSELYSAAFREAYLRKVVFEGYSGAT
ncbi:MAG TPA: pentapeptide repeat-containing protein, partial [Kofleriaceae bacterium]|nr:pentapeptide repeat-containing protein [Kofleriaceae bacterium]